ncbi:MAG: hypothetical protein HW383_19 [Candidatus Magasanikbacteria bacterium]|nr:hypothetical protein [Candidatus Magasanikbacteria bacterium]
MKGSISKHAAFLGFFIVILYVVCLVWGSFLSEPVLVELHTNLLKLAFPGFKGYDAMSLVLGGVLSFVYGFVAALICGGLHRGCCKGMGSEAGKMEKCPDCK